MTNKKTALQLINQIIERAEEDDEFHKKNAIKAGKGSQALGESWMVFHLKALKGLIENDNEWYTM